MKHANEKMSGIDVFRAFGHAPGETWLFFTTCGTTIDKKEGLSCMPDLSRPIPRRSILARGNKWSAVSDEAWTAGTYRQDVLWKSKWPDPALHPVVKRRV
jgi:hypothetical protein